MSCLDTNSLDTNEFSRAGYIVGCGSPVIVRKNAKFVVKGCLNYDRKISKQKEDIT